MLDAGPMSCSHEVSEGEQSAVIAAPHFLDARIEFPLEQSRAGHRPAIRLSRLVTLGLGVDVFREALPLRFAELAQRIVQERGVKGDAGGVKLLDDGDIQSLLREQDFHVAAPARRGNGGVEQRLREKPAREPERLRVRLTRALAALDSGEALDSHVGETDRSQDEPAARSLFERYFCLDDGRDFSRASWRARRRG